jgi:hypothetical protein
MTLPVRFTRCLIALGALSLTAALALAGCAADSSTTDPGANESPGVGGESDTGTTDTTDSGQPPAHDASNLGTCPADWVAAIDPDVEFPQYTVVTGADLPLELPAVVTGDTDCILMRVDGQDIEILSTASWADAYDAFVSLGATEAGEFDLNPFLATIDNFEIRVDDFGDRSGRIGDFEVTAETMAPFVLELRITPA